MPQVLETDCKPVLFSFKNEFDVSVCFQFWCLLNANEMHFFTFALTFITKGVEKSSCTEHDHLVINIIFGFNLTFDYILRSFF